MQQYLSFHAFFAHHVVDELGDGAVVAHFDNFRNPENFKNLEDVPYFQETSHHRPLRPHVWREGRQAIKPFPGITIVPRAAHQMK